VDLGAPETNSATGQIEKDQNGEAVLNYNMVIPNTLLRYFPSGMLEIELANRNDYCSFGPMRARGANYRWSLWENPGESSWLRAPGRLRARPFLAFEYAWKVVNRLYNSLSIPKVLIPETGKAKILLSIGEILISKKTSRPLTEITDLVDSRTCQLLKEIYKRVTA